MINLKESYKYYVEQCHERVRELKTERKNIKGSVDKLLSSLQRQEYFIKSYSNMTIKENEEYVDFLMGISVSSLSFKWKRDMIGNVADDIKRDIAEFQKQFKRLNILNDILVTEINKIVQAKVYNHIIKKFCLAIRQRMIEDGYNFNMGLAGNLFIKDRGYSKKSIDWPASLKLKELIIEKGNVPYEKLGKDEEGNIIDNGGEKWLVTRDNHHNCYVTWHRARLNKYADEVETDLASFLHYFTFTPARGTNGIVKALYGHLDVKPNTVVLYSK